MRFTINLVTRTYLDPKLVNRISFLIIALMLCMLAWNVYRVSWNFGELQHLKADIASYRQRLDSRPKGVSEKEYTNLLADIKFYNEIVGRKSVSWLVLLDQMESATPEGIALSLLAPDRKTGLLRIEGHARSFASVKSYMEKLEDSKVFTSILLLSHSNVAAGEKSRGVQFTISCKAAQK
ncbi:MAG: PilN domain-containing protein [Desulfuromonadales bacterium]|nr:PilN domain-containing protein [Desulfuromonadales bacterium]